jgi:hypothetical protein
MESGVESEHGFEKKLFPTKIIFVKNNPEIFGNFRGKQSGRVGDTAVA